MAMQKKKSTPVAKAKQVTKKPAVAKKPVAKNASPVAKPVKKATSGKSLSQKAVAKNHPSANAKTASKKAVAKNTTSPVQKKSASTKSAPKLSKSTNIIKKTSPVKKTASAGVKKAAPEKLATPKKITASKPSVSAKKPAVASQKTEKKAPQTQAATVLEHKTELRKALKAKSKASEPKKSEKPFVMPKTNTEKARKYEPEFTKSVLDQAAEEYSGPTMRYSDNELVEFRELITRKLETAKKELGYLQGLITRKDQMGGDDTDNRYMTMEDGSLSMEREQLSQMASRQITFIDHLEKAMMRIENKTYGICRVTGKLIDKARLRAVPHATLSIEAKMGINR
jgi:RNA polymerase-binding transcription factor DksA